MIFDGSYKSNSNETVDLSNENFSMEKKLRERGVFFDPEDKADPVEYNRMLRQFMEMEGIDLPSNLVRSFFPAGYRFPPLEEMNEKELEDKVNDINEILLKNHVEVALADGLPDSLFYKYIVETLLSETVSVNSKSIQFEIFDGCCVECEECFQKDYCETAKEEFNT
ncbi:MAG: hypothetical protein GX556_05510 [Fibrobacter sp.]|nr:hypothetical protein [Fibrobacter sp.]